MITVDVLSLTVERRVNMDWSAIDWGNVPTWITAVGVIPTVIFAAWQVSTSARQNRITARQEEDSVRPVVVAQIEEDPTNWRFLEFTLRNVGQGPAYNIRVTFTDIPELSSFIDKTPFWEVGFVKNPLPIMGPGQLYKTLADIGTERSKHDSLKPDAHVVIEYNSINGKEFRDEFTLDMGLRDGAMRKESLGVHDIAKALNEIGKKMPRRH